MNELEILKRKIFLKKQALKLSIQEIEGLDDRLCLLKIKQRVESRLNKEFDSSLSRKLDCINYLLDN